MSGQTDDGSLDDAEMTDLQNNSPIRDIPDVDVYSQESLRSMLLALKSSNSLPSSGDEFDFYSSFSGFRTVMKAESKNLLSLISKILKREGTKGAFDKLDLDDQFEYLIDINDSILERINMACDEASGIKKKDEDLVLASVSNDAKVITTSWNKKKDPVKTEKTIQLLTAKNINRPQLSFKVKVNNTNTPYVPLIKEKPNALKPLAILLENTEFGEEYSHPYEFEIEKFQPNEKHLEVINNPDFPKSPEETSFKFIDQNKDLIELSKKLNKCDKFAVDLEAHSYRSFLGFTCLIQISTVDCDYIIDAIELRSNLHILNESFTNPKIVKVFHGADSDIEWLQRDFGIYVVNLFDTYHASVLLSMARRSLAFLLAFYCKVEANKQYQLADWRIRPLPPKMLEYARGDTHYLLYIYECMKQSLVDRGNEEKNLLKSVFSRSSDTCLRRYRKPILDEYSHKVLCKKSHKYFNARQMFAIEQLYKWRDNISRAEDESPGYVLPNHMLLSICEALPRELQGILACCNPLPPIVKQQLNEIHLIVLKARQKPLVSGTDESTGKTEMEILPVLRAVDTESLLHCPHDLSKFPVSDPTLPTLLDLTDEGRTDLQRNYSAKTSNILIKKHPIFKAFSKHHLQSFSAIEDSFKSPYERFKATDKSVNEEEEAKEKQRIAMEKMIEDEKTKAIEQEKKDDEDKNKPGAEEETQANSTVIPTYDDDVVEGPVREKSKQNRKRKKHWKKKNDGDNDDGSNQPQPKRRSTETIALNLDEEQRPFQAYQYSPVNLNQNHSGPSRQHKHFNPDKGFHNTRGGGKGKSRAKQKQGHRSSHFNFNNNSGQSRGRGGPRGGARGGPRGGGGRRGFY